MATKTDDTTDYAGAIATMADLAARITALEQENANRPPPIAPDVSADEFAALEKRVANIEAWPFPTADAGVDPGAHDRLLTVERRLGLIAPAPVDAETDV